MYKRIFKLVSLSLLAILITFTLHTISFADTSTAQQVNVSFPDVSSNYWAKDAIAWGVQQGLLSGYPDGTFRPDQQMTEAEFASMYDRYLNINHSAPVPNAHWAQNAYNDLAKYQVPLKGYNDDKIKDSAITRGEIAQIVAAKYGYKMTEMQAVYFMYATGLSDGMYPGKTYESYGADMPLTRAQAVAFLQRVDNMDWIYFIANSDFTNQENQYEISVKGAFYSRDPGVPFIDVTSYFIPHFSDFTVTDQDRAKFPNVNVISADTAALYQRLLSENKVTQDILNEVDNSIVKINGLYVPGYDYDSRMDTSGLWFTAGLMPPQYKGQYVGLTDKNAYEKAIHTWVDAGIITQDQYNKAYEFIESYYTKEFAPDSLLDVSIPGPKHCIEMRNDSAGGIAIGVWYDPTN